MQQPLTLYQQDFYAWTQQQANLIQNNTLNSLDLINLLEEIRDMGISQQNQLENRLVGLLMHLLKWKYQPQKRGNSWKMSIEYQRLGIKKVLKKNPSLKYQLTERLIEEYPSSVIKASKETKLIKDCFPKECEWNILQILDDKFFPD